MKNKKSNRTPAQTTKGNEIDVYIASFPNSTQKYLKQIRSHIKKLVPEAGEKMSYGIPTFTLAGNLVHYAGYTHHIGFYPGASGIKAFKNEISSFKNAKGSVQFPLDKPLPLELIEKIVKFRVQECIERTATKKSSNYFIPGLAAPARRALENAGIRNLNQLSSKSIDELRTLHGMGESSIKKINSTLLTEGLKLKT